MIPMALSTTRICFSFFGSFILVFFLSCGGGEKKEAGPGDLLSQRAAFEISAFPNDLQLGDTIAFSAILNDSSMTFDSLLLLLNNSKVASLTRENLKFDASSSGLGTGQHQFRLAGFRAGKEIASAAAAFVLHSDRLPESLRFISEKSLPHNPASFTQGLEWYNGKLYEGTGLNGKSALMELNPLNGETLRKTPLPQEHFGEGITILNNRVYQLTWQSHRAFVYSLPDLKPEASFGYPTEGWGLSHLGKELVMSDGSEKLYFLNPENFNLVRTIQVWDQKNAVTELNELEVVDGAIYANKYQTDTIVKIDPESGKVLGYANLAGLLKNEDRLGNEDVLNGIAWHPAEKRFYLTGKNWPKMFVGRLLKNQAL